MKRNHHILPRLYLNGFVQKSGEPFIWVYRKGMPFDPEKYQPGRKSRFNPELMSIGSPCAEKDYYAYPHEGGGVDYETYENILEGFEKSANPIFAKIRRHVQIGTDEKAKFAFYMVQMHRRVPNYRESTKKLLPSVAVSLKPSPEVLKTLNWPDTEEATEAYRKIALSVAGKEDAEIRTHLVCLANAEQSQVTEYLARMKWRFYIAPAGHGFLTGDNPFFYFNPLGIKNPCSEVSFPISTDVALVATWADNHREGFFPTSPQVVKEINRRTASFALERLYFSRSEPWVQTLLDKEKHLFNAIH